MSNDSRTSPAYDDLRARAIEALETAEQHLANADFSIEAWRRNEERSLPGTVGRVRSHVLRALELLREDQEKRPSPR